MRVIYSLILIVGVGFSFVASAKSPESGCSYALGEVISSFPAVYAQEGDRLLNKLAGEPAHLGAVAVLEMLVESQEPAKAIEVLRRLDRRQLKGAALWTRFEQKSEGQMDVFVRDMTASRTN